MEKDNTLVILFGVSLLALLGFLYWQMSKNNGNGNGGLITNFVRDKEGRIIEVFERKI